MPGVLSSARVLDRLYVQILNLNRFNALSDRVRERLILPKLLKFNQLR